VRSDSAKKFEDSVVRNGDGRSTKIDVADEIDTIIAG
jgi:hypothetical protein